MKEDRKCGKGWDTTSDSNATVLQDHSVSYSRSRWLPQPRPELSDLKSIVLITRLCFREVSRRFVGDEAEEVSEYCRWVDILEMV